MNYQIDVRKSSRHLGVVAVFLLSLAGILTALFEWSTPIVWTQFVCMVAIGATFVINHGFFSLNAFTGKRFLRYYFLYSVFVLCHSFFIANSYEQWSYLANVFTPTLMLPCFAIVGSNPVILSRALRLVLRLTLPVSLLFLIKGPTDRNSNLVFINYVAFSHIFVVLLPLLRVRWRLLVVFISIVSLGWDIENRSNILQLAVCYALLLLHLLRRNGVIGNAFRGILKLIRIWLLVLPIILLALGVSGVFNPFSYLEGNTILGSVAVSEESGRYLGTDSRTGIYEDAFNNLMENNDWLFGSSAVVIYKTQLANALSGYDYGRLGGSESGFLGLLTFGGILYVLLFFLLCHHSSKLAVQESNNIAIELVGIYVAFRWLFSFIELPLMLSFSWVVLFVAMGMAFSDEFRSMSDIEFADYFRKL